MIAILTLLLAATMWTILAEPSIPTKAVTKAYWADVNGNTTVREQWESEQYYLTFAWDTTCYSEAWYIKGGLGLINHTVICNGINTTYALKRCESRSDTRLVSELLNEHFTSKYTYNYPQLVSDPFYRENTQQYALWRSPNSRSWAWVKQDT